MKKGQITIFIIVGVVILFAFLFILSLTSKIQKGQLEEQQENVLTNFFKKEALRLYLQDCLSDELERGLILLGRQGRLWADQPGGRTAFEQDRTGTAHPPNSNERVYYGIAREEYDQFSESYPCDTEENNPYVFCQYSSPNTTIGFGNLQLRTMTLSRDLERFLANRTTECAINFTRDNISRQASVDTSEIKLTAEIRGDGVLINALYPLTFSVRNEKLFHEAAFDFFYPTQFKQLLESAISLPLQWDQRYLDFTYDEETLQSTSFSYGSELQLSNCEPAEKGFTCQRSTFADKYRRLGLSLDKQELENGDDLFVFTPTKRIINNPEPFVFRVARQNRPPALDYVERLSCFDANYDYLTIKDHEEFGDVNITLNAEDPDEDEVSYNFVSEFVSETTDAKEMFVSTENLVPGFHTITAQATDEHQIADTQEVRVLVDNPITTDASIGSGFLEHQIGDSNRYIISREDPFTLNLLVPEDSLSGQEGVVTITYFDGVEAFEIDVLGSGNNPISLPKNEGERNPIYTEEDIENILEPGYFDFHPFKRLTGDVDGNLTIKYKINYCGEHEQSDITEIDVKVVECIPYKNPEHPFAYRPGEEYHNYKQTIDEEGEVVWSMEEINPFEATHACCVGQENSPGNWRLGDENDPPCFINPEPGCYGQIEYYTSSALRSNPNAGYIVEQQQRFCNPESERGNMCTGSLKNEPYNNELRCGSRELGCTKVKTECRDALAWSIIEIDGEKGFCHGKYGCEKFDKDIVLSIEDNVQLGDGMLYEINRLTLSNILSDPQTAKKTDVELGLKTTCQEELRCDSNLDLKFTGICEKGKCSEE